MWIGTVIHQSFLTFFQILLVPAIERAARHLQFIQGFLHTQSRMLHEVNDLTLLCIPSSNHSSHFVSLPSKLFSLAPPARAGVSTRFFKVSSATNCLSCSFSLRISSTSWLSASRFVS